MKKLAVLIFCLALGLTLFAQAESAPESEVPVLEMPILMTSAGQDPQLDVLSMVAELADIKYDMIRMPDPDAIALGVGLGGETKLILGNDTTLFPEGTKYKTIFITMGASMKGMGAAGIDADFENKRVENVVKKAEEEGLFIVGVHLAGEERRHHYLSEGMIDRVAPFADLLLISNDSNKDGRFTSLSEENDIPLILFETEFDIPDLLTQMFP